MSPNPNKEVSGKAEIRKVKIDAYDVRHISSGSKSGSSGIDKNAPAMSKEVAIRFIQSEATRQGLSVEDFELVKLDSNPMIFRDGGRYVELASGEVVEQDFS